MSDTGFIPKFAPKFAMVLAAGLGQRMRAKAGDPPKPLRRVAGKPLLGRMLDRLDAVGVKTIVVNVHHEAEQIETFLASWQGAAKIIVSDERELRLETGGGVKKALPLLGDSPFLVCNADILWHETQSNIQQLIDCFDPLTMEACLLLSERETALGYDGAGDFMCMADGKLMRLGGQSGTKVASGNRKATAPFLYAGVQIIKPELIAALPDGPVSLNAAFDNALERERLFGFVMAGQWMHVGTPEGLQAAEDYLLNQ